MDEGLCIEARRAAPQSGACDREGLRENLGAAFVLDNRPGAGGIIGAQLVADSRPDDYTMPFTTSTLAVNATLMAEMLKCYPKT